MPSMRPSQLNLQSRTDGGPFLDLTYLDDDGLPLDDANGAAVCEVYFSDYFPEHNEESAAYWHRILDISPSAITIYPIHQRIEDPKYGKPRYDPIKSLIITRFINEPYRIPSSISEVEALLAKLPNGFAREWRLGLGLLYEYRFIMEAIAESGEVVLVVVHGESGSGEVKIADDTYYLGVDRYFALKQALDRLSERHRKETRSDKQLVCYTALAHAVDPIRNPERKKKLPPNVLSDLLKLGRGGAKLSVADQASVIELVEENAKDIIKKTPAALFELKAEIELITLNELIERYRKLLDSAAKEEKWQRLFSDNPFILDMAFAYPVKTICDRPYVGGKGFSGRGGNYSDFLMVAKSTGNVAIIEIKHPLKELLSAKPYRNDTYAPSSELVGSVAQAINQRANLQRDILSLADELDEKVYAHAIPAIIVIGRNPMERHEKRSFEQYRNSLKDVIVVTFDELLQRLIDVQKALSPTTIPFNQVGVIRSISVDEIPPWTKFFDDSPS